MVVSCSILLGEVRDGCRSLRVTVCVPAFESRVGELEGGCLGGAVVRREVGSRATFRYLPLRRADCQEQQRENKCKFLHIFYYSVIRLMG